MLQLVEQRGERRSLIAPTLDGRSGDDVRSCWMLAAYFYATVHRDGSGEQATTAAPARCAWFVHIAVV